MSDTLNLVCTDDCLVRGKPFKRGESVEREIESAKQMLASGRFALADSPEAKTAEEAAAAEAKPAAKTAGK